MNSAADLDITRRHFFGRCGVGLGAIARNQLLREDGLGAGGPVIDPAHPINPRIPHFAPKAKRVICLCMAGAAFCPRRIRACRSAGRDMVRDPVHVHDLHATLLHQLGFDHERLTYRFQGRDFRLTDVHGQVVKGLLA